MTPLLEVCCGNWQSVRAAAEAGAPRIELCSALALGGLTPSIGLYRRVKEAYPRLAVHVLIRPREGGFIYSPEEADVMERDIRIFADEGADGIVCGALTDKGEIDTKTTLRFILAAGKRNFTFHRAFDHLPYPAEELPALLELGCTHLLTSGGKDTAEEGIPVLRRLVQQAGKHLTVIPAAGINSGNAAHILHETGAKEIHASCAVRTGSSQGPALGSGDDGTLPVTDPDRVRALLHAIGGAVRP